MMKTHLEQKKKSSIFGSKENNQVPSKPAVPYIKDKASKKDKKEDKRNQKNRDISVFQTL